MSLSHWRRAVLASALALLAAVPAAAQTLPANFVLDDVTPSASFLYPTGIAFLPDGRLLVCEKNGDLWAVQNGVKPATPMWSNENEVLSNGDKGLLSVAVDPHYFANHFIYLLYTVDPDSDGADTNTVAFARLTRYTVNFSDSQTVVPSSRTILLGTDFTNGPASGSTTHTIGSLRWGVDGSLLVSAGDGADGSGTPDPGGEYPALFTAGRVNPYEDIGAFRAQYVGSLDGKILRINPANGQGFASNPFYDGNVASARSKVFAYGFRNPFRFTVKPGTGSANPANGNPGVLYVDDVGWYTWEEVDVVRQLGQNFGWPCNEGLVANAPYQAATPAHTGCGSVGTADNPWPPTQPIVSINHSDPSASTPAGVQGNCVTGCAFYTGARYPAQYQNTYFFCDFGKGWIKILTTNGNDQLVSIAPFADGMQGPVDLIADPVSGDLFYVSIYTGKVFHIRYTGGGVNTPPVASGTATPNVGLAPLTVNFNGSGSSDPDGDTLSVGWAFGDGSGAAGLTAQHTYSTPGTYNVAMCVDDGHGHVVHQTLQVLVESSISFPTTPVVDNFNRPDGHIGNGWTNDTAAVAIQNGMLKLIGGTASITFPTVFSGPAQEAYLTFKAVSPGADEENLMLKVQGPTWAAGHIEIAYDASTQQIFVNTYDPTNGWRQWGGPWTVGFAPGDQFGARAYGNGGVEIFKNGALVGTTSVAGWPFAANGGRIGWTTTSAFQSLWDDFGGGDANLGLVITSGPSDVPSGVIADVMWRTNKLSTGVVRWGSTLSFTDSVAVASDTTHDARLNNLLLGHTYYTQVVAVDSLGHPTLASVDSFTTQTGPLGVNDGAHRLSLSNAWPNPTVGSVRFSLTLPDPARIEFTVHDVMGREIHREAPRDLGAGLATLAWSGTLPTGAPARPGVYLARVTVNQQVFLRRFVLLR